MAFVGNEPPDLSSITGLRRTIGHYCSAVESRSLVSHSSLPQQDVPLGVLGNEHVVRALSDRGCSLADRIAWVRQQSLAEVVEIVDSPSPGQGVGSIRAGTD